MHEGTEELGSMHAPRGSGDLTVIEFVGLPGAGKTTSIPGLRAAFTSRGVSPWTGVRLRQTPRSLESSGAFARVLRATWTGSHRMKSLIHHRTIATTAIRALARTNRTIKDRSDTFRRFAVTLDNYEALRVRRLGREPGGIVIFDEGIAQNAFKLFVNAPRDAAATREEVAAFVEAAPLPDHLVYLSVEPSTCLERLRSRRPIGLPRRFRALEPTEVEQAFDAGSRVLDQVVWRMRERGCAVLEVAPDAVGRHYPPIWEETAERILHTHEGASTGPATRTNRP